MNAVTSTIKELTKVSEEEANKIADVLLSEALLDFSEATSRQYRGAIKLAQFFIANGNSWE